MPNGPKAIIPKLTVKHIKDRKIYTVSEVNYFAKQTLEQMVVWVEGEVSTIKKNPNWSFYYLDLKDDYAVLPCIVSGYLVENIDQDLVGQRVVVFGNLSLYEPMGKYQLRIQTLELAGEGALAKKLEMLIKKLRAEGLFDKKYKKEIPAYPTKVCLITSEGSDAWNDFKRHTVDKFPIIELTTADVRVQGRRTIRELLEILPKIDKQNFDIMVITRGGGSIEDLAAFNDEQVARAIFKVKTPTIVAIGHEANESLSEWVADRRASTPTDAANIVTSGYTNLLATLASYRYQLNSKSAYYFTTNLQRLDLLYLKLQQIQLNIKDLPHRLTSIKESLRRHELYLIEDVSLELARLNNQMVKQTRRLVTNKEKDLQNLAKALVLLSPENTLSRGYSISYDKSGHILRSVNSTEIGDIIAIKLSDGKLRSQVKEKILNDQF